MGTDGACSLLFCAAKRSGAFPPNMPAGRLFPPSGARLFVIIGEAVTSRSRSSPILMGWWSAQCNDFTKVLIAAGRARHDHQQCKGQHKERDHRSGSEGHSEYLKGFHPLHERRCALLFKASALAV
jgi:hypothetical protein